MDVKIMGTLLHEHIKAWMIANINLSHLRCIPEVYDTMGDMYI